jgi:hypothetical protein
VGRTEEQALDCHYAAYAVGRVFWFVWRWRTAEWAGAESGFALGRNAAKWAARSALRGRRAHGLRTRAPLLSYDEAA